MSKYGVRLTGQFKRDVKLAQKSHRNIDLLKSVVKKLADGEKLDEKHRDHALTGNWAHYRDAHILPDLVLIYRQADDAVYLARVGSHSELFRK